MAYICSTCLKVWSDKWFGKIDCCCFDRRLNRTRLPVSVPFGKWVLFIIPSFIVRYGCRYEPNKWWTGIEGSEISDEPQNPSSELTGVSEELLFDEETIATV